MNKPLKLVPIGNSVGVIFPRDVLAHLRVDRGDQVYMTETPDGGYRLSPYNPDFASMMALGEDVMREDRDILHVLAQ